MSRKKFELFLTQRLALQAADEVLSQVLGAGQPTLMLETVFEPDWLGDDVAVVQLAYRPFGEPYPRRYFAFGKVTKRDGKWAKVELTLKRGLEIIAVRNFRVSWVGGVTPELVPAA